MLHSPVFRKSLLGSACFGVVALAGFLMGASVRPTAVEAQSPTTAPPAGSSEGAAAPTGEAAAPAPAPPAPTGAYVDAAPGVGSVGIAAPPAFAPPPISSPITFLDDPRYGYARQLLKQNGVPLESILDPRSTAHPSALVERLIALTQGSPAAMAPNLAVVIEILRRAKTEIGGDARYIQKLSYLQNAATALQTAATSGAAPAPATAGATTGAATGSAINGLYIAEARANGRLADTLMPSPF